MKSIKILYSPQEEVILEKESRPMEVDLTSVKNHYAALGEKHEKPFERFMDFWNGEAYEKFFNPAARVLRMKREKAEEIFGSEFLCGDTEVEEIALAIWTIGRGLEQESSDLMSSSGDIMTGFLLDVAGSVALYNMHDVLVDWVRENIAAPEKNFVVREFYPGFDSVNQNMMGRVVAASRASETIGVEARCDSLLSPRKTQCSFIGIDSTEREKMVTAVPCNPCGGTK
ncbi:MAG: hypothetical protein RR214_08435, partial [Synergistaceae bacterium]